MRHPFHRIRFLLMGLSICAISATAFEKTVQEDVYRALPLKPVLVKSDLTKRDGFHWKKGRDAVEQFNSFSPEVRGQKIEGGVLSFTVASDKAALSWGNCRGLQKKDEVQELFDGINLIDMEVRQSKPKSQWSIELWGGGNQMGKAYRSEVRAFGKSGSWETLSFSAFNPGADGFTLVLVSEADNQIEIKNLRFSRPEATGCFVRDFQVPSGGKIWRAIGSVSSGTTLWVNGKTVDTGYAGAQRNGRVISVDIAPFLRNGNNRVAVSGVFAKNSEVFFYFQGRVVLENGEIIELDAPNGWKSSPSIPENWMLPDYDVSQWKDAEVFSTKADRSDPLYPSSTMVYAFKRATLYPLIEYDGRIVYRNSDATRLWFRSEKPVKLEILIPAGLADKTPEIVWALRRIQGVDEIDVASGTEKTFNRRDKSLVFTPDLGLLPQAVYTLEATLKSDGKLLEKRYREPLMVFGRTVQQEVAGTSFEQGMERELETEIDFTDPKSPYPWVDKAGEDDANPTIAKKPLLKTPRIVRNGDMVYRETQDDSVISLFSYRFEFKHPGDWYTLELDYPNDKPRAIAVSITNPYQDGKPSKKGFMTESGPGVVTGVDVPVSNKMQTLKWIHRADRGEQTIDIVNLDKGKRAAASKVRIYHVKGNLPAMRTVTTNQRFFGAHEERPLHIGLNFGIDYPGQYEQYYKSKDVDFLGYYLYRLAWYADVANHYTQYLRFSGQNFHVIGSYQYNEDNMSYSLPNRVIGSSQVPCDIREALLKYFEANDIKAMSLVEFWATRGMKEKRDVSDAQVAAGIDTTMPVLKNGKQMATFQNYIHPEVEKAYLNIIDDLSKKFADSPAWMGVYLMPYPNQVGFGPALCTPTGSPLDVDYSDATVQAFVQDTGIKVPGEGPDRFQKRYDFLTSDKMKEKWLDWRCQRQRDIFVKTRDVLKKHRKDLNCVVGDYISVSERIEPWRMSIKSYRDSNRLFGFDGSMYKDIEGLSFGRYMYSRAMPAHSPSVRDHWTSPEVMAFYPDSPIRLVADMTGWHELSEILPENADWPFIRNIARFLPRKDLDNSKECFTLAMIMSDPNLVLFGFADVGEMVGQEQQTREIARAITSLPAVKLPLVLNTGIDSNLAIRAGTANGKYYFYVANPVFWNIAAEVTIIGTEKVFDAASGEEVKTIRRGNSLVVPIALGPFGVRTFYTGDPGATVNACENAPLAPEEIGKLNDASQDYFRLLSNTKTLSLMTTDEIARLCGKLSASTNNKEKGEYAAAWLALNDGFCRGLIDQRSGFARYAATLDSLAVNKKNAARPTYDATRKNATPTIDGDLDDPFWRDVPYVKLDYMVSSQLIPIGPAVTETRVKIAYTDEALFIACASADNDIANVKTVAETGPELYLKHDDMVDFFLKPPFGNEEIFQFASNAKGIQFSKLVTEGFNPHVKKNDEFKTTAWRVAAKIGKDRWTLEFTIPFSCFELGAAPKEGTEWRMNFRRRHREFATVPEQVWTPLTRSYYNWSEYGYLKF